MSGIYRKMQNNFILTFSVILMFSFFNAIHVHAQSVSNAEVILNVAADLSLPDGDINHAVRTSFGLDEKNSWKLISVEHDELGNSHSRFLQYFSGIPVANTVLIVHSGSQKNIRISGSVAKIKSEDPKLIISEKEIVSGLTEKLSKTGHQALLIDPNYANPELVWFFDEITDSYVKVYQLEASTTDEMEKFSIIADASTGKVLSNRSMHCHVDVTGTAHTAYHGTRQISTAFNQSLFMLQTGSRGNGIETNNLNGQLNYNTITEFTDSDNIWDQTGLIHDRYAIDAHYCATSYYDFLFSAFNRNSLDNNGQKLISYLNYGNGLLNAFWNGSAVVYGSGNSVSSPMTTLDIAGHEFTHGLIQKTANLQYSGQPGTINEAIADILGTTLEHFSDPQNSDWLIGEKSGNTLRSMADPKMFNQPDTYMGTNWYSGTGDNGGIHINSGFINKWFYLLSVGGQGSNDLGFNYQLNGIGIGDATRIIYHSLLAYLVPASDFEDFHKATIESATAIFGVCSPQAIAVSDAWQAVGFRDGIHEPLKIEYWGDTKFCEGDSISLYTYGWPGSLYSWFHDGTTLFTDSTNQMNVTRGGIWYVSENRCGTILHSDTVLVIVDPLPVVSVSNASGCFGEELELTGYPAGGTFDVPVPYTGNSTTFEYQYTDSNGCISNASGNISINPNPEVHIFTTENTLIPVNNPPVELSGNVAGIFTGLGVSGQYFYPSLSVAGNQSMIYLNYSDINGCTSQDSIQITVTEPCIKNSDEIRIASESEINLPGKLQFFNLNVSENDFKIKWEVPLNCVVVTPLNQSEIGIIFSDVETHLTVHLTNTCNEEFTKEKDIKLAEPESVFGVEIYPVPVIDFLHLKISGIEESGEILLKITDVNGKILSSYRLNAMEKVIDVNAISTGFYHVEVIHGDKIRRSRFIKN